MESRELMVEGFIPEHEQMIWFNAPQYGGLPDGATLRSRGKIATENLKTDVALFQHKDNLYTIDLWTDRIIRIHKSPIATPGSPAPAPTDAKQ